MTLKELNYFNVQSFLGMAKHFSAKELIKHYGINHLINDDLARLMLKQVFLVKVWYEKNQKECDCLDRIWKGVNKNE